MKLSLETVEGGLRFRCENPHGHASIIDSGPGRIAPSPVEMLLVALAGCHGMDVICILRKKRMQVTAYEIDISGERREEHPRRFTRIDMMHRFTGRDLNARAIREALDLSHDKYCSVNGSLHPDIEVTNRFEIIAAEEPQ
jgi:putative redox protein